MTYIEWTQDLSVGVQELDDQHKKMLAFINALFEAVTHTDNAEDMRRIADQLMVYTEEHFTTEEEFMRRCGFPALAAHQQQHIHFMEKIRDFSATLDEGVTSPILPLEMFHFLHTWLTEHIMRMDRGYATYCETHCSGTTCSDNKD